MHTSVRGVDKLVFKQFKAEAVNAGLNVGAALTLAMKYWLDKPKNLEKLSLLDYKAKGWGKGTEKTSQEIDRILYGE